MFDTADNPCSQRAYSLLRLTNINMIICLCVGLNCDKYCEEKNTGSLAQGGHDLEWGLRGEFS